MEAYDAGYGDGYAAGQDDICSDSRKIIREIANEEGLTCA